ncbi:adenosine deaminase [compost metagenome]
MLACLNTDDPAVEGIDLPHEYEVAAPAAGMTASEIRTAQHNGLTLAFLSDGEKAELNARAAQR